MEELSDNARVWRVYLDESDRIDTELVNGWRSTLNTLLIFAGLFASVLATFVTQTAQSLQPPTDTIINSQSLLVAMVNSQREMVSLQRAIATGNISAIPESPLNLASTNTFTPSTRDIWMNGFLFFSLGLTLVTALMTGLAQQWLNSYLSDVKGSPKERACTRRFRYKALSIWGYGASWGCYPF